MILGTLFFMFLFFINFMCGKAAGIKECEQVVRDCEMESLRDEIEELKKWKR